MACNTAFVAGRHARTPMKRERPPHHGEPRDKYDGVIALRPCSVKQEDPLPSRKNYCRCQDTWEVSAEGWLALLHDAPPSRKVWSPKTPWSRCTGGRKDGSRRQGDTRHATSMPPLSSPNTLVCRDTGCIEQRPATCFFSRFGMLHFWQRLSQKTCAVGMIVHVVVKCQNWVTSTCFRMD